jgi:hypothetical protein
LARYSGARGRLIGGPISATLGRNDLFPELGVTGGLRALISS